MECQVMRNQSLVNFHYFLAFRISIKSTPCFTYSFSESIVTDRYYCLTRRYAFWYIPSILTLKLI